MPRVKRGKTHVRRRKRLLKQAKGYYSNRKNTIRQARQTILKAGVYAFRDRRAKKRRARSLWQIRINAASRESGLSYSRLIDALKKKKIELDRKVLADLAMNEPKVFDKIVEEVKK